MQRKIGFEYLRIISMILIIGNHFWLFMEVLDKTEPFTLNFYLVWILQAIGTLGTNCYILISGYFGVESTITWKKVVRLYGQILFYSIILYSFSVIVNNESFLLSDFAKSLLPFSSREYWFVTDYIGLYVLSPFINILLKNLDKKQFQKFISIGLVLFSLIDILPGEGLNAQKGYSLYWLVCVYCIGAYIRLYGLNISYRKYIVIGCGSITVMYVTKILGTFLAINVSPVFMGYSTIFFCHSSIFVLIAAVALFMLLKDINNTGGTVQQAVLKISPLTFGVYLIHMNPSFAASYWKRLKQIIDINDTMIFLWFIIVTVGIYVICTGIDGVRYFVICQIKNRVHVRRNNV